MFCLPSLLKSGSIHDSVMDIDLYRNQCIENKSKSKPVSNYVLGLRSSLSVLPNIFH